ncbi:MAG TPA: hypothetical protein VGM69_28055 [Chloroflexota bacterium]
MLWLDRVRLQAGHCRDRIGHVTVELMACDPVDRRMDSPLNHDHPGLLVAGGAATR